MIPVFKENIILTLALTIPTAPLIIIAKVTVDIPPLVKIIKGINVFTKPLNFLEFLQ